MKKLLFIIAGTLAIVCLSVLYSLKSYGQTNQYKIEFKNKNGTPYSLTNPAAYLSPRAIQRRSIQGIAIDSTDLPIPQTYINAVLNAGTVNLLVKCKWLNCITIKTTDIAALNTISNLPFVKATQAINRIGKPSIVKQTNPARQPTSTNPKFIIENLTQHNYHPAALKTQSTQALSYGSTYDQVHIHEGEYLHNLNLQGQGMLIAMMDNGFLNIDNLSAFDSLRLNNQILDTYDYVDFETNVYDNGGHGTNTLSCIGANLPGVHVGTAPQAQFLLYRTEDDFNENPFEELNWAAAAERADSIGANVFSTSLGYSTFDNASLNHVYAQLNGNYTDISKASDHAAHKGILVINSAGNDGNSPWHYIAAPADGDSVLAIAAVDANGAIAPFSSFGPSSDGQVKPNVASVGVSTAIIDVNGTPTNSSGTSFSCPNLAGLATCLWQAWPAKSNMQILDMIQRSCPTYATPNFRVGYGIPNFRVAQQTFVGIPHLNTSNPSILSITQSGPNQLTLTSTTTARITLYSSTGQVMYKSQINPGNSTLNTSQYAPGLYVITAQSQQGIQSIKIVK